MKIMLDFWRIKLVGFISLMGLYLEHIQSDISQVCLAKPAGNQSPVSLTKPEWVLLWTTG